MAISRSRSCLPPARSGPQRSLRDSSAMPTFHRASATPAPTRQSVIPITDRAPPVPYRQNVGLRAQRKRDAINGVAQRRQITGCQHGATGAERGCRRSVSWMSCSEHARRMGRQHAGAFQALPQSGTWPPAFLSSSGVERPPRRGVPTPARSCPHHRLCDAASDIAANPLYKGVANTLPGNKLRGVTLTPSSARARDGAAPGVLGHRNCPSVAETSPACIQPGGRLVSAGKCRDAPFANPEVWEQDRSCRVNWGRKRRLLLDHICLRPGAIAERRQDLCRQDHASRRPIGTAEDFTHGAPVGSRSQLRPPTAVSTVLASVPARLRISPWSRGGWANFAGSSDHTSVLRFSEARFGVKGTQYQPGLPCVAWEYLSGAPSSSGRRTPRPLAPSWLGRSTRDVADLSCKADHQQSRPPCRCRAIMQPPCRRSVRVPRGPLLPRAAHQCAGLYRPSARWELLCLPTPRAQAASSSASSRPPASWIARRVSRQRVEVGKTLSDTWDAVRDNFGKYDLWALGPNGFHRHCTLRAT